MNLLVLSDIHGNLTALETVIEKTNRIDSIGAVIILGDTIDYGMRSNEVIQKIQSLETPIICNLWGNHEHAICNQNYTRFSSERGIQSAKHTLINLTVQSKAFIIDKMVKEGFVEFALEGKKCLAIHGSIHNAFWESISACQVQEQPEYAKYDYVFSGHSHIPAYFNAFYPAANQKTRNKIKTIFLNPGSVGQPRNLNPHAQFMIVNLCTEEINFYTIPYEVEKEQRLFPSEVDNFYSDRLTWGV